MIPPLYSARLQHAEELLVLALLRSYVNTVAASSIVYRIFRASTHQASPDGFTEGSRVIPIRVTILRGGSPQGPYDGSTPVTEMARSGRRAPPQHPPWTSGARNEHE